MKRRNFLGGAVAGLLSLIPFSQAKPETQETVKALIDLEPKIFKYRMPLGKDDDYIENVTLGHPGKVWTFNYDKDEMMEKLRQTMISMAEANKKAANAADELAGCLWNIKDGKDLSPKEIRTELYISPEALEDIRNWGVDELNEKTRKEVYAGFAPISYVNNARSLYRAGV